MTMEKAWTIFVCIAVLTIFLLGYYIASVTIDNNKPFDKTKNIGDRECVRSSENDGWWCKFSDFEKGKKK